MLKEGALAPDAVLSWLPEVSVGCLRWRLGGGRMCDRLGAVAALPTMILKASVILLLLCTISANSTLVHFGPTPCSCGPNRTCTTTPNGNANYSKIFTDPSSWSGVRSAIDAFNFHVNDWSPRPMHSKPCQYLSDGILQSAATLFRNKTKIAVETGGLRPYPHCADPTTWDTAGHVQLSHELPNFRRWRDLGGGVDYVWMDSPVSKMMKGDQKGNCGFTMDAARQTDYENALA